MDNTKIFAVNLVKEAGEILKKYFKSGIFSVREKSEIDFATEADDAIDLFIKEKLQNRFKDHKILTEESAPKELEEFKNAQNLWILDPIDGTVNFSRGNPNFAISLAYAVKGKAVLGIVYSPILDILYIGQEGEKPTENGKLINVSKTPVLQKSVLLCDWAWALPDRREITRKLLKVCGSVRGIRSTECLVMAIMQLAKGEADLYMTIGQKPWDSAAASLILETAGGKITNIDENKWDIFSNELIASNNILHEEFLKMIK